MGLIPRTDKHLLRVSKLNRIRNADFDDPISACDAYSKLNMDEIDSLKWNDTFFTLGGMKTLEDILEIEGIEMSVEKNICDGLEDGTILSEDEFMNNLKEMGIEGEEVPPEKCEELLRNIQRYNKTKSVIYNDRLYSPYEMINKIYPKFFSNLDKCPPQQ